MRQAIVTSAIFIILFSTQVFAKTEEDDLRPKVELSFPEVYQDMGVVQRKAMNKASRFLINVSGSLDFSDGPYTMYGLNTDLGFAVTDFFEIYGHVTPLFLSSKRSFVQSVVDDLQWKPDPVTGLPATVNVVGKAKLEYGGYIVWAPLYGKDSVGSKRIIRSDTFFRIGGSQITYEAESNFAGGTGLKFSLGVGKTFFMGKSTGFRFVASYAGIQTPDVGKGSEAVTEKSFKYYGFLETGILFYL